MVGKGGYWLLVIGYWLLGVACLIQSYSDQHSTADAVCDSWLTAKSWKSGASSAA
jgi:hypothetical protein